MNNLSNNSYLKKAKAIKNGSDLNEITLAGTYISLHWINEIKNSPLKSGDNAFYLEVYDQSLEIGYSKGYTQQFLYGFNGNIFYRYINRSYGNFSLWRQII